MNRRWGMAAAVLGFLGVAFGAFGAHGVTRLVADLADAADRLRWWETGARFHLFHALALGLTAALAPHVQSRWIHVAGAAYVVGIALFSGSLYVMALTGIRGLGAIAPVGGLAQLTGWAALFLAMRALPKPTEP